MSYSTPFRREDGFHRKKRKEDSSLVAHARQAAEQLPTPPEDDVVVSRPERPEEKKISSAAPPVLELLLYHEEERAAARASGDVQLAANALMGVVRDLDALLDSAEHYLRHTGRGKSRRQVREAMPHLVAISALADLPLAEVAAFLDLPPDRVEAVLASLTAHGGIGPTQRQEALQQIRWLRGRLHQAAATQDHSLLDRLLAFVSRFVLLGAIALASAASGAIAVSESAIKEVIKTGVVALVAAALQMAGDRALTERSKRSKHNAARQAHAALLAELSTAGALWEEPAYDGEHVVVRTRLALRMCAVRVASIPLEWQDKWHYWDLLDDLAAALGEATADGLRIQTRRITALSPPP